MKKLILFIAFLSVISFSQVTKADALAQKLGNCMIDELNGKERKQLAKWIFFAIAAHPEIQSFSKVTEKDRDVINKKTGKLITRLLADNCPAEMKAAYKANPASLEKAFELVGQVAMQEIMTDDNVLKSISDYTKYVDSDRIGALLQ